MIFVPCRGGISHRPDEFSEPDAIRRGVEVLALTLGVVSPTKERRGSSPTSRSAGIKLRRSLLFSLQPGRDDSRWFIRRHENLILIGPAKWRHVEQNAMPIRHREFDFG